MNSNNNNNDNNDNNNHPKNNKKLSFDSPKNQELLKRRKEEMLLMERFRTVALNRLEQMAQDPTIEYTLGTEEKRVLRELNGMGIKEGILATLVTFVVLRKGPIYMARYLYKRKLAQQQQQFYNGPPPPQPGMNMPSHPSPYSTNSNPFQHPQHLQQELRTDYPRSRNIFIRGIWFTFDLVLSAMMGASVSMAYTDTDQMRKQLIDMPLIQGKSLVSDALCHDICQELQILSQENNPAFQRLFQDYQRRQLFQTNHNNDRDEVSPTSYYLQGILEFAKNCQRRHYVERQLQQTQQQQQEAQPTSSLWDDDEDSLYGSTNHNDHFHSVEIPNPISKTGPRLIVALDGTEKIVTDEDDYDDWLNMNTSNNNNDNNNDNWVNNLVSDQEESRK